MYQIAKHLQANIGLLNHHFSLYVCTWTQSSNRLGPRRQDWKTGHRGPEAWLAIHVLYPQCSCLLLSRSSLFLPSRISRQSSNTNNSFSQIENPKKESIDSHPSFPSRLLNPTHILRTLGNRNSMSVATINGIHFIAFVYMQKSISYSFVKVYEFSRIQAGLVYIFFASGSAIAPFQVSDLENKTRDHVRSDWGTCDGDH